MGAAATPGGAHEEVPVSRPHPRALPVVSLAAALLLAGCADDGGLDWDAVTAAVSQGAEAAQDAAGEAEQAAQELGTAGTEASEAVGQAQAAIDEATAVAAQGTAAGEDAIASARTALAEAKTRLDQVAEAAPDQLADLLRSLSGQLDDLAATLESQ